MRVEVPVKTLRAGRKLLRQRIIQELVGIEGDPDRLAIRISLVSGSGEFILSAGPLLVQSFAKTCGYLPWQQLPHPSWQQVCPQPAEQQVLQQGAFDDCSCEVWPNATTVKANISDR
jgi:hypothetical protein